MDSRPSIVVLRDEIREVEHLRDAADSLVDDAFLAGVIRGLQWATGRGMAPAELIAALDRIETTH